jgi:hypothetical protein
LAAARARGGEASTFAYVVWALTGATGATLAVVDWRAFLRPWFALLLTVGIARGYAVTLVGPFTFGGDDYYMQGVLLSMLLALALVGYGVLTLVWLGWRWTRRREGAQAPIKFALASPPRGRPMNVNAQISVGEWIDKLTILEIKLAEIRQRDKLDNVRREYESLLAAAPPDLLSSEEIARLRARLKAVNAELWRIEDEIRLKERAGSFDEEFIALARSVYVANDRRAALKREINRVSQCELVEEKSYAAY